MGSENRADRGVLFFAAALAGILSVGYVERRTALDYARAYTATAEVVSVANQSEACESDLEFVEVRVQYGGDTYSMALPVAAAGSVEAGSKIPVVVVPCRNGDACHLQLAQMP